MDITMGSIFHEDKYIPKTKKKSSCKAANILQYTVLIFFYHSPVINDEKALNVINTIREI